MARDYRHGAKSQSKGSPRKLRNTFDPETARIVKPVTKQHLEDSLRHAVRRQDTESFEDWDEFTK